MVLAAARPARPGFSEWSVSYSRVPPERSSGSCRTAPPGPGRRRWADRSATRCPDRSGPASGDSGSRGSVGSSDGGETRDRACRGLPSAGPPPSPCRLSVTLWATRLRGWPRSSASSPFWADRCTRPVVFEYRLPWWAVTAYPASGTQGMGAWERKPPSQVTRTPRRGCRLTALREGAVPDDPSTEMMITPPPWMHSVAVTSTGRCAARVTAASAGAADSTDRAAGRDHGPRRLAHGALPLPPVPYQRHRAGGAAPPEARARGRAPDRRSSRSGPSGSREALAHLVRHPHRFERDPVRPPPSAQTTLDAGVTGHDLRDRLASGPGPGSPVSAARQTCMEVPPASPDSRGSSAHGA